MAFKTMQAGEQGHLLQYMHEYDSESPKQDSKRFNSQVKSNHFDHLGI